MTLVSRRARKVEDPSVSLAEHLPEDIQTFRDLPAWVLLAEPGAGKTTAFEAEAEATGGKYLRIAEFIDTDPDEDWRGKTLFLDGLDEIRAGTGSDSALLRTRNQLKRLGIPPFRVACRAADWYGSTDAEDLKSASADGRIAVLQLEPLGDEDILTLLRDNHGVPDPHAFVEKAERLGVEGLLGNPQTLGLLAQATRSEDGLTTQWPETRAEIFRLACEKLAEESNKRHRDKARARPRSVASILDAAGQLCAVLLLSDQTGIALDPARVGARFIQLDSSAPSDFEAAAQAVRSKLFRQEGVERFVPSHRSVAEYLAARWLARQIDNAGLPLGRVLNLLLGQDGRTVAGLRGLYAWLALHSQKARPALIEADPLTVVLYGDVKPMPTQDKRRLLDGLRREAENYHGFRWGVHTTHPFGALADPELRDDFLAALQAQERDDANQAFVDCVLDILSEGGKFPALVPVMEQVVRDPSRKSVIRKDALKIWLRWDASPQSELALLNDITTGRVADEDDELAGILLRQLYPEQIAPESLFQHLHRPKQTNLIGIYLWFWEEVLPDKAPEQQLPALLDDLVEHPERVCSDDMRMRGLHEMADALLTRAITLFGDAISDERLFAWLGIGTRKHGGIAREDKAKQTISEWMGSHPERYKALLAHCFKQCESQEHAGYCARSQTLRLQNAAPPKDMGLWHLEQADKTVNNELTQLHLINAVNALIHQRGMEGLSLELIETWAATHPDCQHLLEPLLAWEIDPWRIEDAANRISHEQEKREARRTTTARLQAKLQEIQSGTARVDLMHQLAGVWMDLYLDTRGDTPAERFDNYCENGPEILAMAETGFRRCPLRDDLPTVDAIVDLAIKQQEHFIRRPCLVGMELRWRDGEEEINALPDETLRRMLAFRLTDGTGNTPDWFLYLVRQRPELVAEVLIDYANSTLKVGKEHVDSLYALEHDSTYHAVALVAAPALLASFPVRARSGQLHHLENLLKATLRYAPEQFPALIERKLSMKGMDAAQKVYWLATASLLNPQQYETELWRYVGKSESRANYLSGFLGDHLGRIDQDYAFSAGTLGKLIERITPHAEIERPTGGDVYSVTDAMRRGDQIRALINRLSALATPEAELEINRLLGLPALYKLKHLLEATRHELKQRRRESEFRFLSPLEVAQVLANQAPASIADLAALALDILDDIARDIRQGNDDGFRAFWNIENKQRTSPREENLCRDALLTRLRTRLDPLGVDCQPEADYANDKRADIRLSYQTRFGLPIEIKRDSNVSLWSALRDQLIGQYAIEPRAYDHGIYLVLWFGGEGMPRATDGGKKPRSPEELRTRLEAQLDPLEQRRIFIRVLDVSWPA
ncbi:MAG: hypothetical protein B7Y41_14530 [Hydrogenophilales bacterium 28-61-23]|nr:MAG: hypothetical protein B7Y41_14530 [Hydrogenophilales bacterium 28-61-23]